MKKNLKRLVSVSAVTLMLSGNFISVYAVGEGLRTNGTLGITQGVSTPAEHEEYVRLMGEVGNAEYEMFMSQKAFDQAKVELMEAEGKLSSFQKFVVDESAYLEKLRGEVPELQATIDRTLAEYEALSAQEDADPAEVEKAKEAYDFAVKNHEGLVNLLAEREAALVQYKAEDVPGQEKIVSELQEKVALAETALSDKKSLHKAAVERLDAYRASLEAKGDVKYQLTLQAGQSEFSTISMKGAAVKVMIATSDAVWDVNTNSFNEAGLIQEVDTQANSNGIVSVTLNQPLEAGQRVRIFSHSGTWMYEEEVIVLGENGETPLPPKENDDDDAVAVREGPPSNDELREQNDTVGFDSRDAAGFAAAQIINTDPINNAFRIVEGPSGKFFFELYVDSDRDGNQTYESEKDKSIESTVVEEVNAKGYKSEAEAVEAAKAALKDDKVNNGYRITKGSDGLYYFMLVVDSAEDEKGSNAETTDKEEDDKKEDTKEKTEKKEESKKAEDKVLKGYKTAEEAVKVAEELLKEQTWNHGYDIQQGVDGLYYIRLLTDDTKTVNHKPVETTTQKAETTKESEKLPETGEATAYAVFGGAALSILAGIGLITPRIKRKEQ